MHLKLTRCGETYMEIPFSAPPAVWPRICLVPRPHFSSRPKRFGSRGPCENVSRPFASDTSPKRIDQEELGKRRTGTRQKMTHETCHAY